MTRPILQRTLGDPWECGFGDGMDAARIVVDRARRAANRNPIRGEPYWAGYAKALDLACEHMKAMTQKAKNEEH